MPEVKLTKEQMKERFALALAGVGNDFVNVLKKTAPTDTGNLRNSIKYKVKGKVLEIRMPHYAVYVEYGTPPHIIRPKTAKALAWKGGNGMSFAKVVHHPGTQPQPFIRNAIRTQLKQIMINNFKKHVFGV